MNAPWGIPPVSAQHEETTFEQVFPRRLGLLALVAGLLGLAILLRVVLLLLSPTRQTLVEMAETRRVFSPGPRPRGLIFDAQGNLLAGVRLRHEVNVRPSRMPDKADFARVASNVLGLPIEEVWQKLNLDTESWVLLSYDVTDAQVEQLEEKYEDVDWLSIAPVPVRDYPEGSLASNVLGFVRAADQKGVYGVEQWYDALLEPPEREQMLPLDPSLVDTFDWQPHERYLVLTIQRALQAEVERLLDQYVEQQNALGGAVVVLDVHTGAVLAMASAPRPDLNRYDETVSFAMRPTGFNRAIDFPYEPGSVFKVVVMAAALDAGLVDENTIYNDIGVESAFNGSPVYNWDRQGHGQVTMQACLQYSLNTCLAWVAKQFGAPEKFYAYLQAFGIGKYTGVDLAGENPGFLPRPGVERWSHSDWVRQGFGQALSVTPLQMAVAAAAIANGGYLMTPYVVQEIHVDGFVHRREPEVVRQVIDEDTARKISQWLIPWDDGEAVLGRVEGYTIAGKTGTAEVPLEGVGYASGLSNASYVGWLPVDDPQVVIYVWLERPDGYWASKVVAPLFSEVAERVAVHLGIPPDNVRRTLVQRQP